MRIQKGKRTNVPERSTSTQRIRKNQLCVHKTIDMSPNNKDNWEFKYFRKLKYFRAKCKLCPQEAPVVHLYADMIDVKIHFEFDHPEIDTNIEILWLWQYYKINERDSSAECKECGKKYMTELMRIYGKAHLLEHDIFLLQGEDLYQSISFWNYITQSDDWHVKCHECDIEIEVTCMLTALNYHMYAKHRDIWNKEQYKMCKSNIQKITNMPGPSTST